MRLLGFVLLSLSLGACNGPADSAQQVDADTLTSTVSTQAMTASVAKINCHGCVKAVNTVIEPFSGVVVSYVDLPAKRIDLSIPAGTDTDALAAALDAKGHPMADLQAAQ